MKIRIHSLSLTTAEPRWNFLCLSLAVLLLLCSHNTVQGQEIETDEETQAILDAEMQQRMEEDRARDAEFARQVELRLQAIDQMRGSEGVYSPQLLEAYGDLAALYEEIEDYDSAVAIYTDALQISRINSGLYSEEQIPVIQSLIRSNSWLRNWEAADDLQELRFHMSSRLYPLDDLNYLAAAQYYGAWKLRLLRENLLDLGYRSYSRSAEDLSDFYERLIADMDIQPTTRPENMIDIFQGKSEADLVLVRAIASTPYSAFEGTASRYVYQQRCRNVRNSSGQVVRECVNVQVENPRYRQSQVDAKRYAMDRGTRDVQESIDRLRQIYEQSDLSSAQREQLESQIAELETETYQLLRQSRSRRLF